MAVCLSCGSQVGEDSKFCTACGKPMAKAAPAAAPVSAARTCLSCGATADPSSAFCTICGARLSAAAAAPEATPPSPPPNVAATSQTAVAAAPSLVDAKAAPEATPEPEPAPEPTVRSAPASESSYPPQNAYAPQQPSSGGKFGLVILILLIVIAGGGLGAWYFWGVETIVVCSPPDVTVFLDEKEIAPTSYGRYVIPHLSRKEHLLKIQSPGFADTLQRLDFPLISSQEWVNIKLVPSQPSR